MSSDEGTEAPMTPEALCWHVARSGSVSIAHLARLLAAVATLPPAVGVDALEAHECVVVGPVRGHGADLARMLLAKVVGRRDVSAVVFLGNMIDGGCQSIEVLGLVLALGTVAGLRVVALRGAHEFLFPISPDCTGRLSGRLEAEVQARCGADAAGAATVCTQIAAWFAALPLAVVVNGTDFLVSSGIAHGATGTVAAMNAPGMAERLVDMLINDPMDEDDEDTVSSQVTFAANLEREVGHVFTFNATCHFLTANRYRCIIRGTPFTTQRTSTSSNSCGRPWHFQYSPNDAGYRLYRKCPTTGLPGVISLFSAPGFCCANTNLGAIARLSQRTISIEQFGTNPRRPLQLPGATQSAFHWSMPFVCTAVHSAVSHMLFGALGEAGAPKDEGELQEARGRRLLRLLQAREKGKGLSDWLNEASVDA
jgi:hypothetical protein